MQMSNVEPINPCKDQNQHAYQVISYPQPGTKSTENPMGDMKMLAFCMRCGDRQDIP